MSAYYREGDVVFGNWTLDRKIGEGSFGQVYEASRTEFGETYKAAIKIITIPQSESEIKSARAEGMDDLSITTYFRSFVEEIVQEFALMSKLKGNSNIVSYEDHMVTEHKTGIGWDILIRMELLTPLLDYIQRHPLTRMDVIKLGIDLNKALELCQKYNIVHRDIKPENIFVSDAGDYKLGDFGIARTVEKTTGGLSKKGTYTYMAPEVYKDEPYGSGVDIYSLGLVMYRLLNENRAPFLPEYPAPITHSDRETALARRISGAAIPAPKSADGRLAEIVLKACAYQPKDRYSSPMQMRTELEAIQYSRSEAGVIYPAGDEAPIKSERNIPTDVPQQGGPDRTSGVFDGQPEQKKPFVSTEYDRTTSSLGGEEKTSFDKTQSIFDAAPPVPPKAPVPAATQGPTIPAAPVNPNPATRAPVPPFPVQPAINTAFQPGGAKPKQKYPKWIIPLSIGIAVLLLLGTFVYYLVVSFLEYELGSTTTVSSHTDVPTISAPSLDNILTTPAPKTDTAVHSEPSVMPATPQPVTFSDSDLILPSVMAIDTRATPYLSFAQGWYGMDTPGVMVATSDPYVVEIRSSSLYAAKEGTSTITFSYGTTSVSRVVHVCPVNPDSSTLVQAEFQSGDDYSRDYLIRVQDPPEGVYTVSVYSQIESPIGISLGEPEADGVFPMSVQMFEGEEKVLLTVTVTPQYEPENILAFTTIDIGNAALSNSIEDIENGVNDLE